MAHPNAMRGALPALIAGISVATLCATTVATAQPETAPIAQTPEARRLSGTFVLADAASDVSAEVDAELRSAVAELSWPFRGIAERRLREGNPVPRRVQIELVGDRIVVSLDDEERFEGREGEWLTLLARGEASRLVMQRAPERLYLTFQADAGQKQMVFTGSGDGAHVWLDVELTSPRLRAPITYRVAYRRANSPYAD